jgi:hypothetical protein
MVRNTQLDHEFDNDQINDMVDYFRDAHIPPIEEELAPSARAFFEMSSAVSQPLHEHVQVYVLDAVTRLLAVKSQFSASIAFFDALMSVICTFSHMDIGFLLICVRLRNCQVPLACHMRK